MCGTEGAGVISESVMKGLHGFIFVEQKKCAYLHLAYTSCWEQEEQEEHEVKQLVSLSGVKWPVINGESSFMLIGQLTPCLTPLEVLGLVSAH